jgi:predicted alpha/beta superfamily hydrolase
MSGTASHALRSAIVNECLRIDVSLPLEYETTTRAFPVVYLLDGNWMFPIVSHIVRPSEINKEMPPLIVVGIGYDSAQYAGESRLDEFQRIDDARCRDFAPTPGAPGWWKTVRGGRPLRAGIQPGHAAQFLRAIENEVKPLVREQYRVDPQQETLAGYSLGALCVLLALYERPSLFDRYLAASPALWWDDGVMLRKANAFAGANDDLRKTVFLSVCGREEEGDLAPFRMVSNLRLLSQQLEVHARRSLRLKSLVLEGETHASGIAPSFLKGLQWIHARDQ